LADGETDMFSFKIAFGGQNARHYILGTNSHEDMEKWLKALSCASYDYLKAVIAELQKQLDEITETEKLKFAQAALETNSSAQRSIPFNDTANLIDLSFPVTTIPSGYRIKFTDKPFSEIHGYYENHFSTFVNERRTKANNQTRLATNQTSIDPFLIDLLA